MRATTIEQLTEILDLADQLREGRDSMQTPQDLPGRFGLVVQAVDRILQAMNCESVLAGGWAVWRLGFAARVTEDIDIVLPANRIEEFMQAAEGCGFERLPHPPGRWPKLRHNESGIKVDILPEGARPGNSKNPAPTTIPHPSAMGAVPGLLRYIQLASLFELKLAAGRARDRHDVVELIHANPNLLADIRQHLQTAHETYASTFDHLVERAREEKEER
jgi:aminoglycoside-2''-adenylyltransferase